MSLSKETARIFGAETDTPQILAVVKMALQNFLDSMAAQGFKLPVAVSLNDSHGDCLRVFTVQPGGVIEPGGTDDASAVFVLPLTAIGTDANGRTAVMKITERGTEESYELKIDNPERVN